MRLRCTPLSSDARVTCFAESLMDEVWSEPLRPDHEQWHLKKKQANRQVGPDSRSTSKRSTVKLLLVAFGGLGPTTQGSPAQQAILQHLIYVNSLDPSGLETLTWWQQRLITLNDQLAPIEGLSLSTVGLQSPSSPGVIPGLGCAISSYTADACGGVSIPYTGVAPGTSFAVPSFNWSWSPGFAPGFSFSP